METMTAREACEAAAAPDLATLGALLRGLETVQADPHVYRTR